MNQTPLLYPSTTFGGPPPFRQGRLFLRAEKKIHAHAQRAYDKGKNRRKNQDIKVVIIVIFHPQASFQAPQEAGNLVPEFHY